MTWCTVVTVLLRAAALQTIRTHCAPGNTTALAKVGLAVVAAQGDIGQVELAPSVAMASGAFERFAAGVVAPMAGAIHREDLTVPEDIIEQMREMGAFGLSIPEAYGGSATGHDDDTMMMIAVTEALSEASLAAAGSLIWGIGALLLLLNPVV